MASNNLDQQIRTRIESFLDELVELVRASTLASVHAALGADSAPIRRRGPGRPRGSVGRRTQQRRPVARPAAAPKPAASGKRLRRSAADLEQIGARVLAHVKSNPGQRLEEIGKILRTDTGILKRPITLLLAARSLRTEGQKRGTKYFAGGARGGARKSGKSARGSAARKGFKRRSRARARRSATKAQGNSAPVAQAA